MIKATLHQEVSKKELEMKASWCKQAAKQGIFLADCAFQYAYG